MRSNNSLSSLPRRRIARAIALLAFFILVAVSSGAAAQTTQQSTESKSSENTVEQLKPGNSRTDTAAQTSTPGSSSSAPASAASTAPAPSGKATPQKSPRQLKIGGVNFNGSLRLRAESHGWFETPGFDDDYTFGAAVLRLSLGQQRERYDWQLEGAFPVLFNLPEQAVAPAPQGQLGLGASYFAANGRRDASAVVKQAYVRVKGIFGDKASSLRAGRFEFVDGMETTPADATLAALKRDHIAHRLIGHFGFSHVGRSFDAVQYVRQTRAGNFTFVGGRPTEGVFQLRSLKELDVDFWYGAYTRPLSSKAVAGEFRVLALHYHDGRGALKTDNRTLAARRADTENIRLTTVGGNYVAAVKTGRGTIDLLAWGVGQFGRWGNLDHRAGALVFEGGFQPGTGGLGAKWKPWLRAGYSCTTGDGDAADGRHTTFFQVLPTPRIYARFPFYNMMNTEDAYLQLKLKPHARLSLRAEAHHLRLSNRRDLWYVGGGAFQESSFGYVGRASAGQRGLGTLFDMSADLSITPTTVLTFYGAGVRGGSVQASIYPAGGANPTARFFYAELTKRF
ncbi:MAG TPA: alginate export family protein [Pyrinomonadaceae bacterium]|nr:alginate export family protein [Pyrinomonadaceae bacterium]